MTRKGPVVGENFPRVLVGEMDVKPSGLIVTLGGD